MKILIRADANEVISSGHVMRCLAIAETLHDAGVDVQFCAADMSPADLVEGKGFAFHSHDAIWNRMGEAEGLDELSLANTLGADALMVDTYSISREYVSAVSRSLPVCYLGSKKGDLGPLAMLVNYSTVINGEFYRQTYAQYGTELLLGPRYAPLRSEFRCLHPREQREKAENILVTTGNTDPHNVMGAIIAALLACDKEVRVHAVVGAMFAHRDKLLRAYAGDERVNLIEGATSMSELMMGSDIAVSANGTTVYELSACGIPAVTFAMVDEQIESGAELGRLHAVAYCGAISNGFDECVRRISSQTARLISDCALRAKLAASAHALMDGNGALRIADALMRLPKRRR